jgi:AraC-like DNA-binding protein
MPRDLPLNKQEWSVGAQIGDRSGFAKVYEATGADGTPGVVKLIPKAPGADRELLFEELSGVPNIVPVIDSGETADEWIIAMPRADRSLRAELDGAGGRLTPEQAIPILIDITRALVPPHREGGQAQYIEAPMPRDADEGMTALLAWIVEHLDEELGVEQLARRAVMSPRTLARRFKAQTGTTPLDWVLRQRIALAQRMLESTDLPVEIIASRAGFGTPVTMRHHFAQRVHTSPQAYRRTFRGATPGPAI